MTTATEIKKCQCMWCHSHCRVAVYIENGKLVKIEENKQHPFASAYASVVRSCPRARAAADWFYHPDRLKYPLKRVGERGSGRWQKVTWEEALDGIAGRLKKIKEQYGAEAIATTSGTGRTQDEYRCRFFSLLGSPNHTGQGQICWGLTNMVSAAMIGFPANFPSIRPGITKCLLFIGHNPAQAERVAWFMTLGFKNAGGKLIVIDPRRTELTERADLWLQARPGTDCALLMSMVNVIIQEGLYDREFVDKWCYGFDKLAERAREYSPEKVAPITWISPEKIREAARIFATTRPAVARSYMGVEHLSNSVEALHARYALSAITGNIDVRGGNTLRGVPTDYINEAEIELSEMLSPEQKAKALGSERFKLMSLPAYDMIQEHVSRVWGKKFGRNHHVSVPAPVLFRAMATGKPYPVKALLTVSSNPMVTLSNTRLIYQGIKNLDTYVVLDFFMTPSADLADYVLPAASWLERPGLWTAWDTIPSIDGSEGAFSPVKEGEYERRADYDFWRGLGVRMGQEAYWPWKTFEESLDERLKPLGCTLREFMAKGGFHNPQSVERRYEKTGFATPTGKVELYSTVFEKLGYDPLPRFYEVGESLGSNPELAKEYPLVLITGGRFQPMYHSEWRQVAAARKQHPDPILQIHPQTAKPLGIEEGDWAWIETPRGRIKQKCHIFDGIDPRVVHAEHGWWFPERPGAEPSLHGVWESNINAVIDDEPDHCNKISGSWPLRGMLCRVYKVEK